MITIKIMITFNNLILISYQLIFLFRFILTIFSFFQESKVSDQSGRDQYGEHLKFERKDAWDMKWADVII